MTIFASDDAFWKAFERMDALNHAYDEWHPTTAYKPHTDEFGVHIETGEQYFRRPHKGGTYSGIVISRSSMEKIVFAMVCTSPSTEEICDVLLKEKKKQRSAALKAAVKTLER